MADETSSPKRHSLLELAGIDTDEDKPRHRGRSSSIDLPEIDPAGFTIQRGPGPAAPSRQPAASARPAPAEMPAEMPEDFPAAAAPVVNADEDDFLKLIEEDVKKAASPRKDRRK